MQGSPAVASHKARATPAGKLDVNGAIYQRGGVLHADCVFDADYALEPIEDHAKFMWSRKHLPGVPKACVDADGWEIVEIGSQRKGILEELEKAHIHIEQLHRRANEKDARIAELEPRLAALEALVAKANASTKGGAR